MSTPDTGIAAMTAEAAASIRSGMDVRAQELRQLELEDPILPEEMLEARDQVGFGAGKLAVLAKARANRVGRPPGARNKRTDDLARYLLGFGTDPLVGAMIVQSTPPEILAEAWGCKVIEAVDRQIRCRELVSPYIHSKKPVAVDLTFNGVADLMIEGVTHTRGELDDIINGDFMDVPDDDQGALI